jgi:hypothetical protein
MSSFFRSAVDISSSREDDSTSSDSSSLPSSEQSDSDNRIARVRTLSTAEGQEEQSEAGALAESSRTSSYHRDLLLHALLEERCHNEALDDLKAAGAQIEYVLFLFSFFFFLFSFFFFLFSFFFFSFFFFLFSFFFFLFLLLKNNMLTCA